MRTPWFDRAPALLQHELDAIRNAGFHLEIRDEARALGFLVLTGKLSVGQERISAELHYPASFPYGRPEVRVDVTLSRHSSPYERILCLWPGAVEDWDWNEQDGRQGAYALERAVNLLSIRGDDS